jgi:hypothetical protein
MNEAKAKEWAAQAWCTERTSGTTMNVVLAEEFANILLTRVNEELSSYKIRKARQEIASAFYSDEAFYNCYVANVAMLLNDRYGITDRETRTLAANDILKLIFDMT